MSEFKGTPGPYEVGYGLGITGPSAAWAMPLTQAFRTRLVTAPTIPDGDRLLSSVVALTCDEANAHLLAASWEMYEALWQLDAYLDFDTPWTKGEVFGDPSGINEAMKQAKAAIAKALGEQP